MRKSHGGKSPAPRSAALQGGGPPPPRFAALHVPAYRQYFVVDLLSMTADNIEHVISYWVIFQVFHSPTLAGFAVISHWVPFLLFSLHAGALADRYDCRKLIQISQVLFMSASVAWAILILTGTLQMWHAVVILMVHGAAGVVGAPASQLIIHDMVPGDELASAIRLNATSRYLSILLGPAIGGGLMLLLGTALGLLVNVLIYVPFSVFVRRTPFTGHSRVPVRVRSSSLTEIARAALTTGLDRRIVTMIVLAGASSFFVGNAFQAQMPEYAEILGTDDTGMRYSILLAANAAGAIVGALLLEGANILRPSVRTAIVCAGLWGVTMGLFPMAQSYQIGGGAACPCRSVQHHVHVNGPDACAGAGASGFARCRRGTLHYGHGGPPGRQRSHRRRAGRVHRHSTLARVVVADGGLHSAGALCVRDARPKSTGRGGTRVRGNTRIGGRSGVRTYV